MFETHLNYTLELSSYSSSIFICVYTGDSNEITLMDLRPNKRYMLRVFTSLSAQCRSACTNECAFHMVACVPEAPTAPRAATATKKKN